MTFSNSTFDVPEWVGYLAYEMGGYSDADVIIPLKSPSYPIAHFHRYPVVVSYQHLTQEVSLFLNEKKVDVSKVSRLFDFLSKPPISSIERPLTCLTCTKPLEEKTAYYEKVLRAKQKILMGDIYQVNLSQECRYQGQFSSFDLFKRLYQNNPAPFSAYLNMSTEHKVVSSSPERLLSSFNGKLETRPIKGTAARGRNKSEDKEKRERLLSSSKDKSELLMITDLMRNDLGKVAVPGSVRTEKIWHCEEYQNVFHLLSVITAEVLDSFNPVDVIREVFPGGSITGCPKIRAMEVISEIEDSNRGIYTGSLGYFTTHKNFDFNIAIRTLDIINDVIKLRLGGAIVTDSIPEKEYDETLHKGRSIFETLNS
ncbi:MAG: anthranilate synthase component I family protein [Chlamydiota bacterium]